MPIYIDRYVNSRERDASIQQKSLSSKKKKKIGSRIMYIKPMEKLAKRNLYVPNNRYQ